MTRYLFLPVLALVGCDAATDSADTGEEECGVTVTTFPTLGSVDAYYRGAIEFKLSKADTTAEIETSIPGTQSTSADGLTVYWTPSAPLEPSTPYSATLHYCGGDIVLEFTTSSLGTSIADDSLLEGRTFNLALADARIVEPPGIGTLLSSELDGVTIYVGVTELTDDSKLKMLGALGREGAATPTQEYCDPSIDFPVADFANSPHFVIGGEGSTDISVAGVTVTIDNLEIAGDFASDLSFFGGGTLKGTIDTRPLDIEFGEGEEGFICNTASALGVVCQPCSSDQQPFCLSLVADSLTAEYVAGLELVEILGNDCEGCDVGVPADSSETCPLDETPM